MELILRVGGAFVEDFRYLLVSAATVEHGLKSSAKKRSKSETDDLDRRSKSLKDEIVTSSSLFVLCTYAFLGSLASLEAAKEQTKERGRRL